jgi:hypothetical protein
MTATPDPRQDRIAGTFASIRLRQARTAATGVCIGSGLEWDRGPEPTCLQCHRTPAELGVEMPARHKASTEVWNGRVPRHAQPGRELKP